MLFSVDGSSVHSHTDLHHCANSQLPLHLLLRHAPAYSLTQGGRVSRCILRRAIHEGLVLVLPIALLDFTSTSCVGDLLLFRSKQTTACKTNEPTLKNNEQILKPCITWETQETNTKNNKMTINANNRRRPGGFRAAGQCPLN